MIKAKILEMLEHKSMSGEQIRQALDTSHERTYMALVQLEAVGSVEVVPVYRKNVNHGCVWRNCEVLR